ncbi:glycosyltransferase family 2 protein [Micromonospora sp. NBS 11-29]|uniref:glycosyltransferase family 2 protein n=1 Tax=Micromonospora sp. NBS 11-29 TaxID=1960879 RepID=UPI000B7767B2|nr:glycosyltransferase family 2 protein [Micromonospora sp. NBS 11-29]
MSLQTTGAPELSVVMPTFQDPHCLELTLRALARQTLSPDRFEVVVVRDGGSPDGYPEALAAGAGLRLRLVESAERRGRSAIRNEGVRHATAPLLVFLDADSWALPDLLERHLAHHRVPGNPEVLIGRRDDIGLAHLGAVLRDDPAAIPRLSPHGGDMRFPPAGVPDDRRDWLEVAWTVAYTHNISLSRELFDRAGGFREEFALSYGMEDIELFYRVDREGAAFGYDDEARVVHLPHHRNMGRNWMEMMANTRSITAVYPCLEWEFLSVIVGPEAVRRIMLYRSLVRACVERSTCAIGPAVAHLADRLPGDRTLWVGTGSADAKLPDSALTFDYAAPVGPTNFHLIGLAPPIPPGSLDAVVSVDFWRYLLWPELCQFVNSSLLLAGEVHLVATGADAPEMSPVDDTSLAYLRRSLAAEFTVDLAEVAGLGSVLSLRPPRDAGGTPAFVEAAAG